MTDFWWTGFSLQGAAQLGSTRRWRWAPRQRRRLSHDSGQGPAAAPAGMKDFTWYQYLFTQFRAIFVYSPTPASRQPESGLGFSISKSIIDGGSRPHRPALLRRRPDLPQALSARGYGFCLPSCFCATSSRPSIKIRCGSPPLSPHARPADRRRLRLATDGAQTPCIGASRSWPLLMPRTKRAQI